MNDERGSNVRNRFLGSFVALVAVLLFPRALFAQNSQQASPSKTPGVKAQPFDPHNISGIWKMAGNHPALGPNRPALTAWGYARWSQTKSAGRANQPLSFGFFPAQKDWNDPEFQCDPAGYPRIGKSTTNYKFVQLPGEVLQFFEIDHFWRDLWTDGRKLPNDPKPRWYGYSIAHWNGNTLVVESAHFDERTWLDGYGSIHSDQMQLEERYEHSDRDRMQFAMTLTDPKAYTAPWVSAKKQLMELLPTSDGVQPGLWGYKSDGTEYEDMREDYCIYSQEHSFWTNYDPEGTGGQFDLLP
jgi:hypothetical protein